MDSAFLISLGLLDNVTVDNLERVGLYSTAEDEPKAETSPEHILADGTKTTQRVVLGWKNSFGNRFAKVGLPLASGRRSTELGAFNLECTELPTTTKTTAKDDVVPFECIPELVFVSNVC